MVRAAIREGAWRLQLNSAAACIRVLSAGGFFILSFMGIFYANFFCGQKKSAEGVSLRRIKFCRFIDFPC